MLYFQMDQFDGLELESVAKLGLASRLLKSRIDKTLLKLVSSNDRYISAGSCMQCRTCIKEQDQPCIKPDKMSYSFEAMGIDVVRLTQNFFGHQLQWFANGKLPEYTTTVGGLLTNSSIEASTIIEAFKP